MSYAVIIPTLNEAEQIAGAVGSAWAAGARQVLVADGGSRDDTVDRARAAGAEALSTAAGRSLQQNAGARQATCAVLQFLHADCRLPPDAFRQIRDHLATPRAAPVGAFRQRIDARGWAYRCLEWGNARRVTWWGTPYGDQGIWLLRDFFWELGGFPEEPFLEDLLLMHEARRRWRPALLDGPLLVNARRWQRNGVLRQTLRNWSILWAHRMGHTPEELRARYR